MTIDLEGKLYIFRYSQKSASGRLLADKTGALCIKHENSTYTGKAGQYILNWGAGTGYYAAKTGQATLLNPPKLIDLAVNKLDYFQTMLGDGGPRVPYWTTQTSQAKQWLSNGETVIARTKLEGARGDGLVVMHNPTEFVPAALYTVKVPLQKEYRVYMWKDEVLDVRIKEVNAVTVKDDIMSGSQVEFFQLEPGEVCPRDVLVQAVKAAKKLPLTTQGIDVLWDGTKAWVLETNTAPYLGIQTANKYAVKLAALVAA